MFERRLRETIERDLAEWPAVAMLGPRQSGKTTLARRIAETRPSVYLDLESERDRARLVEPELYLPSLRDKLVVLDEVHRAPGLFPVLRGQIDEARRSGRHSGLYLMLGSAALDLLRQSGESLAGRVNYLALGPLDATEVANDRQEALWVRGGFPDSFLAADDARSLRWRQSFVRTSLERDIPQFGPRIPAETLRRFWTMLAHQQGGTLNVAQLAANLDIDAKTANRYIDLLCDLMLVRRLPAWHANVGKRLVKSPKVYVRDSGVLHALLGLPGLDALLAHPVSGPSWEGFALENLLACAGPGAVGHFYRTSGGAEIDLLLAWPGDVLWAIEVKRSLSPKVSRGFHEACRDLSPARRFLVYPGTEPFPGPDGLEVVPLETLCRLASRAAALGPGPAPDPQSTNGTSARRSGG